MELRQLRYFVTLAEELHFGRAARREHIVQSALSQQLKRLERELGVRLLERTTHRVRLSPAGSAFLVEAREILAQVHRAAAAAERAGTAPPALWVGTPDASYDSIPQILRVVQDRWPDLEIHQVELGVADQIKLLVDGRLDLGFGRAAFVPPEVGSELCRMDPLCVLISERHRLAALPSVPLAVLAEEPILLSSDHRAPEFNQFLIELCRTAGFTPRIYPGTVDSIRAAVDLVVQGRCLACVPASSAMPFPGVRKLLIQPMAQYPWSVLWRISNTSEQVRAVLSIARGLSRKLGWRDESPLMASIDRSA
jgi:DNA-binding transcriptional LysR family regulator